MALPVALIVITGEIDLSVASMLGLAGVSWRRCSRTAGRSGRRWSPRSSSAASCGVFNGVLVTRVGLPSLAVTIGTLTLYRGIAQGILPNNTVGGFPQRPDEDRHRADPAHADPLVDPLLRRARASSSASSCTRRRSAARSSRSARTRRPRSSPASASSGSSSGSSSLSGVLSGFAGILWTLRFASARYDSGIGLELQRRHDRAARRHLDLRRARARSSASCSRSPCSAAAERADPRQRLGAGPADRHRRAADRERDRAERG